MPNLILCSLHRYVWNVQLSKYVHVLHFRCMFTENYQLYVPESAPVGKAVGKIKANDEDLGINAEMTYSITNAEGAAIFSITSDKDKREGVISLKKVGYTTQKCAM